MEPNRAVKHEDSDWHTCAGRRPMVSAPAYWQASPMMIPNTPEAAASQNKCSDGSHRSPITRQKMPSTTLASGCRMSMTVFDAKAESLKRYAHQIKEALKDYTHFGMEGGLPFAQEHEVLDRKEFRSTPLLRMFHGKALRQLGTSGGGNHFVEFGELELTAGRRLCLPRSRWSISTAGSYPG